MATDARTRILWTEMVWHVFFHERDLSFVVVRRSGGERMRARLFAWIRVVVPYGLGKHL
jgi:hypothetical protein